MYKIWTVNEYNKLVRKRVKELPTGYIPFSDLIECLEHYYEARLDDYNINRLYLPTHQMSSNGLMGQIDTDTMYNALCQLEEKYVCAIEWKFNVGNDIEEVLNYYYDLSAGGKSFVDWIDALYITALSMLADILYQGLL